MVNSANYTDHLIARVAELVYAYVSEAYGENLVGSSPTSGTSTERVSAYGGSQPFWLISRC